jgi:hypothetical protein
VHVDLALEAVALGLLGLGDGAGLRSDEAPPRRRHEQARPLRQGGQAVSVAGGLAGEGDRPARAQHAAEFGEGLLEIGDVVQDSVAEDEIEALVLEGQLLGLSLDRLYLEAQALGGPRQLLQHPCRDVGGGEALDHAELQQVEREVAGAGADLQPRAEALAVASPQRLEQLCAHLFLPGVAEVDAPLGVVFVGRRVVVAGVDVFDVLRGGGGGGRHQPGNNTVPVRGARVRPGKPARGGATAAADRRAHAS